jgi:hypothetical protein
MQTRRNRDESAGMESGVAVKVLLLVPLVKLLCDHRFLLCHFDRKNLSQQILEWRNLAVLHHNRSKSKISPLRSFLATVEMTLLQGVSTR